MNNKEYSEVKQTIAKILQEYNITSSEDFDSMDEETGSVLYENLKAGVLEEFDIEENEMNDILDGLIEL